MSWFKKDVFPSDMPWYFKAIQWCLNRIFFWRDSMTVINTSTMYDNTTNSFSIDNGIAISPITSLTFANGCSLSWKTGKLEFTGPVGESAKLFFEYLKPMIDTYIKMGGKSNLDYLVDKYEQSLNNSESNGR